MTPTSFDRGRSWSGVGGHHADEAGRERLHYLDHLRASVVILVVMHHVALVYGAAAPFYYVEPPFDDPLAGTLLAAFVLINQSWFMGALFLLAGYFTPGSIERGGARSFVKARLVRLGVPILVFMLVLGPLASIGFFLMPASLTGITAPLSWSIYPKLIGLGPLWFVAMLLIFDVGYAVWWALERTRRASAMARLPLPGYLTIGGFIVALALASYLIRMVVPLGKDVDLIVPAFRFPTLAYLPQYVAFFVIGIVARGNGWLRDLPGAVGAIGLAAALVATLLLFPLAISGRLFSLTFAESGPFVGNGTWQSAVYALWDSATAVGLGLGLVVLFRRFFDGHGRLGRFLSEHSYAVYVVHAPVIVYIAFAMRDIDLPALAKFAVAAFVVVPVCFAGAYAIRRMPLVSNVL